MSSIGLAPPIAKFCVFCGEPPAKKTSEHVIPRWLIELTGDPKRLGNFGPLWDDTNQRLYMGQFSFDQFKFPACKSCNEEQSGFEAEAKNTIESILRGEELSANALRLLLSWLDKVRVGLWLGSYYFKRAIADIEPHLFINNRMNTSDRLVFIYKSQAPVAGLGFPGANTPIFGYLPVCFALRVNEFTFFNISTDFILARRMGLPYPIRMQWGEWPEIMFELTDGRERVTMPLIRKSFRTRCTQIYQPMIRSEYLQGDVASLYSTDYTRSMMKDVVTGEGNVFRGDGRKLIEYSDEPSSAYIPDYEWEFEELSTTLLRQVLEFQIQIYNEDPDPKTLPADRRTIAKYQKQYATEINRLALKQL